jgi:hypothetical protein
MWREDKIAVSIQEEKRESSLGRCNGFSAAIGMARLFNMEA